MNKKFIWLSVIALIMTFGQSSFACPNHDNTHGADNLVKELNLTPEQQAKLQTYKEKAQTTFKTNYAKLRTLRTQINALVQNKTMDEIKLDSLIDEVNKIRGSMLKSKIMMQHQMFMLLDSKQQTKFLELKKKWDLDHGI